jgi:hypothetical protein
MEHNTSDFKGRELTAIAIAVAAIGSASLNTWGAFHIFPNWLTGLVIAGVILACELIAFLSPRHIIRDHENRHYWKARGAAVILVFAIIGCIFSGKQAFHVLFLEADHTHQTLLVRADAREAEARAYHENVLAGNYEDGISRSTAEARWERMQTIADTARLEEMKAKPPHEIMVYIMLALFEMVKIGGLFFVATAKKGQGLTMRQRKAKKNRERLEIAKADAKFESKLEALENGNVVDFEAA